MQFGKLVVVTLFVAVAGCSSASDGESIDDGLGTSVAAEDDAAAIDAYRRAAEEGYVDGQVKIAGM